MYTTLIRKLTLFLFCFLIYQTQVVGSEDKKLLVLIIASDNHPAFIDLQNVWRSYMYSDPEHVEVYFMKCDPDLPVDNVVVGDTIYTKMLETYRPGILEKTILSMEFMLDKIKECDYVLRTNLSSFYYFPALLEYLKPLPKSNCYCAHSWLPHPSDVTEEYLGIPFGWGAGFILSPDLVEMLVTGKSEVFKNSESIPDDVLIGAFLHKRGIGIIPKPYYLFTDYNYWNTVKDSIPAEAFHFRAKSSYVRRTPEEGYKEELMILKDLVRKYYSLD